jgi:hypothetical protein
MTDRHDSNGRSVEDGPVLARNRLVPLVCLAMLAALLIAYQTRYGPGASGDSTSYLMGAENLLNGNGFSRYSGGYEIRPITGFPPFYSMVLAALGALGSTLVAAARGLDVVLIAVNVFLVGWLVQRHTNSVAPALIAQGLVATADSVFLWHTWVMSEPLYVALSLLALAATLMYFDRSNWRWLIAAGLAGGLATLTRYVGLSLIAACALAVLVLNTVRWRRRFAHAAMLFAAGLVPVGLWLARNVSAEGTAVNRELSFRGVDANLARLFMAEISSWFVPHEIPLPTAVRAGLAIAIAASLVGYFVWWAIRNGQFRWKQVALKLDRDRQGATLLWLAGGYIVLYFAALAANSLFLDASTTPNAVPRYLVPVYIAVVIFMVGVGQWIMQTSRAGAKLVAAGYLLLLFAFYGWNSFRLVEDPLSHIGYMGYKYRWADVVRALDAIGPDRTLISNNPEIVYILIDRPAYVRPIRYDQYQDAYRQDYEDQLEATKERIAAGARLVIFRPLEETDLVTIEYTGAEELASFPHAAIYGRPE